MKTSLSMVVIAMSLSAQTAFAQSKSCFSFKSGQAKIRSLDTHKTEEAVSVEVILENATTDKQGEFVPERLTLKAKSKTMKFSTVADHFSDLDPGVYIAGCDGGSVQLSDAVNGYNANSENLIGSIGNSSQCNEGNAVIVLKNLNLEETICAE